MDGKRMVHATSPGLRGFVLRLVLVFLKRS